MYKRENREKTAKKIEVKIKHGKRNKKKLEHRLNYLLKKNMEQKKEIYKVGK